MEKMRKSLDAQMTSQFKELVTDENEKRFFHELKTQDDWSVTCRTIDGRHQPIENPGHMLRGTLAYLGSLRNTSRIEFPVVLDNPAAPLDKPGREALATLLVENAESQTSLLTHSGGYELDNLPQTLLHPLTKHICWKQFQLVITIVRLRGR